MLFVSEPGAVATGQMFNCGIEQIHAMLYASPTPVDYVAGRYRSRFGCRCAKHDFDERIYL
jgi:hypothetical protein